MSRFAKLREQCAEEGLSFHQTMIRAWKEVSKLSGLFPRVYSREQPCALEVQTSCSATHTAIFSNALTIHLAGDRFKAFAWEELEVLMDKLVEMALESEVQSFLRSAREGREPRRGYHNRTYVPMATEFQNSVSGFLRLEIITTEEYEGLLAFLHEEGHQW